MDPEIRKVGPGAAHGSQMFTGKIDVKRDIKHVRVRQEIVESSLHCIIMQESH